MRALLFAVLAVLGLAIIGWVSFQTAGNRPGMFLETQQIQEDTQRVLDAGREAVDDLRNGDSDPAGSGPRDNRTSLEVQP